MNNDPSIPQPDLPTPSKGSNDGVHVGRDVIVKSGDFVSRDKIIEGDEVRGNKVTFTGVGSKRAERNRAAILQLVNQIWVNGVLDQSLLETLPINLQLRKYWDAVEKSAWLQVIDLPPQPDQIIPAGTQIVDIFAQTSHSLLILGEPGAGKTMLLLTLARDTIAQARQNPQYSIPIVLNLSTWAIRRLPLADWLIDELQIRYDIPRSNASEWVDQDELMLLLDGLDEVAEIHRAACVDAINQFRQDHLVPMAVCCRLTDYEALPNKLKLTGAVVLQNLTSDQIDHCLFAAGPTLDGLRRALQKDNVLQELAQTPLMLGIMAQAYRDQTYEIFDEYQTDSLEVRRQQLFDLYVNRMFTRTARTKQERYPQTKIVHWLKWLAKVMVQRDQSAFFLEEMQANYLNSQRDQWFHRFGSRTVCGLILILAGILGSLCAAWIVSTQLNYETTLAEEILTALGFGAMYALYFGIASALTSRMTATIALLVTCLTALLLGSLLAMIFGLQLGAIILVGVFITLQFSLPGGFAGIALADTRRMELSETLHWSWRRGLTGLLLGLLLGLGGGYLMSDQGELPSLLTNLSVLGPPVAIIFTLLFGLHRSKFVGTRLFPNQGFFRARRNALWIGSAVLFSILLVSLSIAIFQPTIFYFSLAVSIGFGLPLAVSIALYVGGGACIQQIVLRLLLLRQGNIPWNLTLFLDYAVNLIFLRRVGNSYIFLHRTLMEYFCSKQPSNPSD